jgi:hypothetical protein
MLSNRAHRGTCPHIAFHVLPTNIQPSRITTTISCLGTAGTRSHRRQTVGFHGLTTVATGRPSRAARPAIYPFIVPRSFNRKATGLRVDPSTSRPRSVACPANGQTAVTPTTSADRDLEERGARRNPRKSQKHVPCLRTIAATKHPRTRKRSIAESGHVRKMAPPASLQETRHPRVQSCGPRRDPRREKGSASERIRGRVANERQLGRGRMRCRGAA